MKAARFLLQAYLPKFPPPVQRRFTAPVRKLTSSSALSFQHSPLLQLLSRNSRRTSVRHLIQKRLSSSKPPFNPTPHLNSPEPSLSLSQRFRKLSREYGWSALGVYFLLTALDFPFCFLAVKWLGTDRVGHWEHIIVEWIRSVIPSSLLRKEGAQAVEVEGVGKVEEYGVIDPKTAEIGLPAYDHGVKEAEKLNQSENASIWTQLALAYAIHKSFIFLRVPLTAAVTPKVVKTLRGWGWDVGKRRPKVPKDIKIPKDIKKD